MFFERYEGANWVTFLALPSLCASGWLIYSLWTIGLGGWLGPILCLCALFSGIIIVIKNSKWEKKDLRWLVAPAIVLFFIWYIPWWDYHHQRYDTGAYLRMALTFIGSENFYFTEYRSPIIPGILSIDLLISGNTYTAFYAVICLFIASLWQFQHLAERWASKKRALICMIVISLLPVFRYWGQMAMTDVASAAMWIFTLHILIKSENDIESSKFPLLLGLTAGMTFLSKQTHVYLFGLFGWLVIKDRKFRRAVGFLFGWLIITIPYFLDNLLTSGNAFDPLLGQTTFAVNSMTGIRDSYTTETFLYEFFTEISIFLLLASVGGIILLFIKNRMDFVSVLVMASPLLLLNAVILDWGEPRYNTPIFALVVILSGISILDKETKYFHRIDREGNASIFSYFSIFILVIAGSTHALSLPDDSVKAEEYNLNMDLWTSFEVEVLNDFEKDKTLVAGRASSIMLMTGIDTYRYKPNYLLCDCEDDIILNSILTYSLDYALTTNVGPYFPWEKDFDWQLGHSNIELQDIHYEGWWTSALWRIDNTSYLSPDEYYSNYTGRVTGDLLILGPNESFTVGEYDLSIKWIEVTQIRPYQQVMRILAGETSLMKDGCILGDEVCTFSSGEQLTSSENHYTYAWIEHKSS